MASHSVPRKVTDLSAKDFLARHGRPKLSDAPSFERLSLPELAERYERSTHDDLDAARGIYAGLVIGAALWAGIILAGIWLVVR